MKLFEKIETALTPYKYTIRAALVIVILLTLFAPKNTHPANITWLGTTASAKTAANWVDGVLPGEGDVWVLSSTNNNALTVDSNFTNAGIAGDATYTATVALQSYEVTATGNVALGGAVISAGTSTFKAKPTSGTMTLSSAGETWYDIVDSSMGATLSTSDNLYGRNFTKRSTSTGPLTFAGDSLHFTGDCILDAASTPALTFGTAVNFTGASSQFHVGSGLGTTTAASLVEYWNTATAGVRDDDKGITAKAMVGGANFVMTNSGGVASTFQTAAPILTFTNGGTLTLNTQISLIINSGTSGDVYAVTAGSPTINGTSLLQVQSLTGVASVSSHTLPAMTYTGSATVRYQFSNSDEATLTFTGNQTFAATNSMIIRFAQGAVAGTFSTGNYSVIGSPIIGFGRSGTSTTSSFLLGSSSITSKSVTGLSFANGIAVNLGTCTWTNLGNWTWNANDVVNPGTSTVRATGTGTWTLAGKQLNILRVAMPPTSTFTPADSVFCTTFCIDTGLIGGNKPINVLNLCANKDSTYLGTGMVTVRDSGSVTIKAGGALGPLAAGYDLSGSAGKLIRLASTVAGTQARLHLPGNATIPYISARDINSITYTVTPTNSVNLGNTTNFLWPSTSRRRAGFNFGFGFRFQ